MRFLVVVLVLVVAFAGCVTKKDDKGEGGDDGGAGSGSGTTGSATRSTTRSTTASGTQGTNGTGSDNHPPTASMTANGTGAAPASVVFLLNGTDADGDALAWALAFGDGNATNGTSLPANVTYAYPQPGAYNATLTVSDGKATTNVTLQLNLTASGPAFEQFVASGTPDLACPQCSVAGANTGAGYRNGINELDSWFVEIPAGAAGQPFTLVSESTDPDMVFRTSCASSGAAVGNPFVAAGPESGIVPEGALCALTWNPEDVVAKITLTIG